MKAKLKNFKDLFLHPKKFFSRIDTKEDYLTPLLFYVFIFVTYHVVDLLLGIIYFAKFNATTIDYVALVVFFLFNMALVWVIPFVQALIIHAGVVFFGVHGYYKTFQATAYGFSVMTVYLLISTLLTIIPAMFSGFRINDDPSFVIGIGLLVLAGFVHSIYATARGLQAFDNLSFTKALIAVLFVPLILLLVILASIIMTIPFIFM
ncbi:MAG: YIP1 family protein [Candidatus Woesearchaeota archaeon]